uniref:RING-type E3 ubiquitin transferase n=2 Tax=Davidia involucrata TaxID=16924 RepID=A0A5B6YNF0_DAVIN
MQNEVANVVELPYYCSVKVHRLMCLDLMKFIDRISQIFSAIESVRPGCVSGIQALCSLQNAMEKAKLLILHCSYSSKIYLAITGDKIMLRCEKIRSALELCLSQLQNMVPPLLASQISRIVDDLRVVTFTVESSEDEAGKVVLALIQQDMAASDSVNMLELKALQLAALRLHITSHMALLIEKRSIKKLLDKILDTDPTKKKILKYLLYLLRKYGKSIGGHRTENNITQHKKSLNQSTEPEMQVEKAREEAQLDVFDTPEPPDEFLCPLSERLMYDPVIIANGQTYERVWIEKWFNDGHETCPKTRMKLSDLSWTPNFAIKDLILGWSTKHGITIPGPCSQPTSAPLRLQKNSSSSSIASFGSSLKELRLQISNVSLRSSDTNCDSLDSNIADGFSFNLPRRNAYSHRVQSSANGQGISLALLSKLAALPWASQCKAVEDVKNQLKDNNHGSHSMFSNSYIKPLIRFLKNARDLCDSKAQRDGAQLLLAILSKSRTHIPPLHEDAIFVLSSFLDSEITEEALAIMEVLSSQQYYKSEIVASGVLPSILRVLEMQISEFHLLAMKILCNLSAKSDIGHHMIYLDYIPKLAPFLGDRALAGYCIKIFRNLCNTEEARVAVAESNACIASIAELLEIGTDEEQELAMDILLSLCYQCAEYCQLVMKESIVQSLDNISVNGNTRGKVIATELLQLLRDFPDAHAQEGSIPNTGLNLEISRDSADRLKEKKSSKASGLLGKKMSKFSKAILLSHKVHSS